MAEAMSAEGFARRLDKAAPMTDAALAEIKARNGQYGLGDATDIIGELLAEVQRLRAHLVAEHLAAEAAETENDQLRAQLAEIGETREEFGVRTYDNDEDVEVMSSREQAQDLADAWRREIPGSNPRVMVRTRQRKPGDWSEVPDA